MNTQAREKPIAGLQRDHRMIILEVPQDQKILAALGVLTIRHGQLDYILRMTIKSLTEVPLQEVLDATTRDGTSELRKRVLAHARKKLGESGALLKLQALLERSRRASTQRNEFIHSLWAHELDGKPALRNDDHSWREIPSVQELDTLSKELVDITVTLNKARLEPGGFIYDALNPPSAT